MNSVKTIFSSASFVTILLALALISCSGNQPTLNQMVPSPSEVMHEATPTYIPGILDSTPRPPRLATSTEIPGTPVRETAIPSSTNSGTDLQLNPSFPDLAVEVANQSDSLFFCDFEQYPGQIWFLKYPYRETQWRLADPKTAYYHPVWSPDGSMLGAISVEIAPPTKKTQYPEALVSEYPENERIWLVSPDGLTKRQISLAYPRYQTNTSEGECLTSGLHWLLKWSYDSRWIVVDYGSYLNQIDSFISFINVNTDQHFEIKNAYDDGSWAFSQNTFALIDNDLKEIMLVEVKDSGLTKSIIVYPSVLDENVYFTNIAWTNENKIILVGSFRNSLEKYELWELDSVLGQWTRKITFNSEDTVDVIDLNSIALCEQRDNNTIDLFNLPNKFIEARITKPSNIDCFSIMPVIQQNKTIGLSYFSSPHATEIWFSSISGAAQKVLATKDIHFPEDFEIGSISWRP
jgi:hypothetical protein